MLDISKKIILNLQAPNNVHPASSDGRLQITCWTHKQSMQKMDFMLDQRSPHKF